MSIDNLLARLNKVRNRGGNQWMASCPCHEDKTPSLSIKDDNGTILMRCFSQECGVDEICGAIGIDLSDLFPPSDNYDVSKSKRHDRSGFEPDQVLFALIREITTVQLIAEEMAKVDLIDEKLKARLDTAVRKIHSGWMYAKKYGIS